MGLVDRRQSCPHARPRFDLERHCQPILLPPNTMPSAAVTLAWCLSTNGKGTIDWAGGLVQWDSQCMENGYYYATFDEVSVQCYDPPSNANINGSKSYIFTDDTM